MVAEACSGVSFFIASFVIGSLYAYLNLASVKRRAAFVIISLIFPILANIVRVYGIILIAYWTDMEHAAGADHLIYGWFFFAFVIVCLLGIGELMRQQVEAQIVAQKDGVPRNVNIATVAVSVIAIVVSFVWQRAILDQDTLLSPPSSTSLSSMNNESCPRISWEPIIVKPDTLDEAYVQGFDCNVKAYTAWFSEKDNELVSDLHRLFDPERFSLEGTEQIEVKNLTFTVYHIVSTQGERLSLVRWYRIDGKNYVSTIKAKTHQLKNKLGNQHKGGRMWVLGIDDADLDNINSVLEKAVGQ